MGMLVQCTKHFLAELLCVLELGHKKLIHDELAQGSTVK